MPNNLTKTLEEIFKAAADRPVTVIECQEAIKLGGWEVTVDSIRWAINRLVTKSIVNRIGSSRL